MTGYVRFGLGADIGVHLADVWFTLKADIAAPDYHVRFVPIAEIPEQNVCFVR